MVGWLTTSRKATLGALATILSPFYVLVQSEHEITGRAALAALMGGFVGWALVYVPSNTEPYEPRHKETP